MYEIFDWLKIVTLFYTNKERLFFPEFNIIVFVIIAHKKIKLIAQTEKFFGLIKTSFIAPKKYSA